MRQSGGMRGGGLGQDRGNGGDRGTVIGQLHPLLDSNRYDRCMDLLSTVEIARLLGVTRQRVDYLTRTEHFPRPLAELAIGRVWALDQIKTWAAQRGRTLAVGSDPGVQL